MQKKYVRLIVCCSVCIIFILIIIFVFVNKKPVEESEKTEDITQIYEENKECFEIVLNHMMNPENIQNSNYVCYYIEPEDIENKQLNDEEKIAFNKLLNELGFIRIYARKHPSDEDPKGIEKNNISTDNIEVRFERNYFNTVELSIVYNPTLYFYKDTHSNISDIAEISNMYTKIDDNWYIYSFCGV